MAGGIRSVVSSFNEKKHKLAQNKNKNKKETTTNTSTILNKRTSFTITEAYKSIRTNIIFSLANETGCKKILVTSSEPGEGKSTTTLNLAITFAQTGAKVLVIDCDLRKPRLHRYIGTDRKNGLSDLLIGLVDVKQAIYHHDEYNLDCITAGQIPPNPVELLSSRAMQSLMDYLSDKYDYIFIDTPPVTLVTDACSMAKFVSGYVVVVRQNYTIHELLEKTRSSIEFAEGKLLGYVVNDTKPTVGIGYGKYGYSRYGYRYRYRYGYKYGYRYGYGYKYGYGYSDSHYGSRVELAESTPTNSVKGAKTSNDKASSQDKKEENEASKQK